MRPGHRPISYADLVVDRFQNWPLTERRVDHPPGRALTLHDLPVVHLHREDSAEVFLTQQVSGRLGGVLSASGRVDVFPDTGWAQVRLDTDGDLFLLQSLVSLAIQANDSASRPPVFAVTNCPMNVRGSASEPSWRHRRVRVRRGRANLPA
ncbi:luciferase family protein [Actinoallomurus iriomotensis]|uniref:Luciferase domain-containing protein n=1 Tax=Actinoallomurus iriomotensis TaxID=478107 RepID=A0A9W6S809_9ACTN|nr:luciferase family protein [Actinoallomurus iriomotensis]GLY88783.1 hypothetical protein Airi02_067120 [Actinoallomurus iriomotensis]